jgi:hypothetical protein
MRVEYDPRLLEETSFQAMRQARGNGAEFSDFRRRSEAAYELKDPQQREHAFQALHRNIFLHFGFDKQLDEVIRYFPNLQKIDRLVMLLVERRKDEEAELFSREKCQWSVVFRIRAETILQAAAFKRLAMHDFYHISDMLDPDFKYSPTMFALAMNAQQQEMLRDRFRCLWDLYIDARLAAAGQEPSQSREAHEFNFVRNFGASRLNGNIFELLWKNQYALAPDAPALLMAGSSPEKLMALVGLECSDLDLLKGLRQFADTCPLCNCPTKDWSDPQDVGEVVAARIRQSHPTWQSTQPFCRQCEEIYTQLVLCGQRAGGS